MKTSLLFLLLIAGSASRETGGNVMVYANARMLHQGLELYCHDQPDKTITNIQALIPHYIKPSFSYQQTVERTRIKSIRKNLTFVYIAIFLGALMVFRKKIKILFILIGCMVISLLILIRIEGRYQPNYEYLNDYVFSESLTIPSNHDLLFYEKPDLRPYPRKIAALQSAGIARLSVEEITKLQQEE